MKHYTPPTKRDLDERTLKIDPQGIVAKKLKRIGVDIKKEQAAIRGKHEKW